MDASKSTPTVLTKRNAVKQDVVEYSPYEKFVARLLFVYLLAAFVFGFWAMADAFHGGSTILAWFRPKESVQLTKAPEASTAVPTPAPGAKAIETSSIQASSPIPGTEAADTFILLATGAGWLGATIAAMRSLCDHYAATVENASNPVEQEANRFHTQWSIRWFAGPLMGAGLALLVFALVQSGVLPFEIGAYAPQDLSTVTVKSELAAIGFGALVGLAAKDVIEKLIQGLKSALRIEEQEDKALRVLPQNALLRFGGQAIRFTVKPEMPVSWAVEPTNFGSITNGVFRTPDTAPGGISGSPAVVVTATSKADASQSASAILILEKPADA